MKWRNILLHKVTIISLSVLIVAGLAWYGIATVQKNRAEHDAFIGDIENLYYYLKKEPFNMEKYSVLLEGDSVSISVWQNYISTSDSTVRNYERMLIEHAADYSHYDEIAVLKRLGEALQIFKQIRAENRERVENRPEYKIEELNELKNNLNLILEDVVEMGKKHNLDLR
jgi:hypothetical protein